MDQAVERINRMAEVSEGLVGITRNESALDHWCLTVNEQPALPNASMMIFDMVAEDVSDDNKQQQKAGPSQLA